MLPVDFLNRVVAWPGADDAPGWINLHWMVPPAKGYGMRGRPYKDLPEFMSFLNYAVSKPAHFRDLYFCLSTQRDTGKVIGGRFSAHRHASKAMFLKALWLDIDVKPDKGYASLPEAVAAVSAFRTSANLPVPTAIVKSGGGLHVYWISSKPLTLDEWRPYAEGLKAEVLRLGLKCDAGLTADAARVLRVPGTFNQKLKEPRPVEIAYLAPHDHDFTSAQFMALATKAPARAAPAAPKPVTVPETPFTLPEVFRAGPAKAFGHLDPREDSLAKGITRDLDLPLDKAGVFKGCQHFRDSFLTHGKSQSQGLWMLTGLACTWLEGGREIFHTLSRDYPTYTPEETDKMFDRKLNERAARNLGWPSCKVMEGEGAKCKGCAFYNHMKSPLNLAEQVVPPPQTNLLPPPPEELELPDNHTVDEQGRICRIVEKEDRHGNTVTQYVPLFWCKLRNFRAQADDRKLMFETSLDGARWGPAEIDEATDLINDASILKALRQRGVKPNPDINSKLIISFMTSFMAKLDAQRERQGVTVPFGWLREDTNGDIPVGFAYGGRVYMRDGTEREAGLSDSQLEAFYRPKGSEEAWWKMLHIVTARHHPALEVIIATSFAAPLAFATGLYNGVVCAWSPEGGAHKSTSIAIGAAVWGSPKLTKERPKSSQKGVLRKLGFIKNLPVYWDEINSTQKMDEVREITSDGTEGTAGSKLKSNRDFHVQDEWQTMMLVGANKSLVENITLNKTGSDAQLHRVFEYQVEKRPDTVKSYELDTLTNALDYNYGHIGTRYSKMLGTEVVRVRKLVQDTLAKFAAEVNIRSEERFRCAMAATINAGAILANELGCNFNTEEIWQFVKAEFLSHRNYIDTSDIVTGSATNSANFLSKFMKTFTDNALWIDRLPARSIGRPDPVAYIAGVNHMRPRPVHIRLTVSDRVIDISRIKFIEWLMKEGATPSGVIQGLIRHYAAIEPGRINLAAGAGVLGGGREPVIRIPVPPGSPFEGDLLAHSMPERAMPVATATVIPITRGVP